MPAGNDGNWSIVPDPYSQGGMIGSEIIGGYPGVIYQGDDFDVRSTPTITAPAPSPSTAAPQQ